MRDLKITLRYKNEYEREVSVEPDVVMDAAMLVYKRHYFIFQKMDGRSFTRPLFQEVNAPVDITEVHDEH